MWHSQHEIEKYLDAEFTSPGFFLEIGCWDGTLISQSAWLERERGWRGLCVDPFPRNFSDRPTQVCHKAISADGMPRRFVKVFHDRRDGGDVSYFSGFEDSIQAHAELIRNFCSHEMVDVPTITIPLLYDEYKLPLHIDFLSVDTEGAEIEIFESIDFSKFSYGMIVFEHNESEIIKRRIGSRLGAHGYEMLDSLRCDDIYVKRL
jgi:FkbM family methyltransferase